jgi:hypothetical protein
MAQHSVKLRAGLQPQQDLARPDSDGQALAAFGAACIDHGAAAAGAHASQKAMGAGTLDFGRLVSAFHDLSLKNRYLQVFKPLGHSVAWPVLTALFAALFAAFFAAFFFPPYLAA